MNALSPTPSILETSEVGTADALAILQSALHGADDGELFLERSESEMLVFDDGRLKSASLRRHRGLRPARGGGREGAATPTPARSAPPRSAAPQMRRPTSWPSAAMRARSPTARARPTRKLYGEDDPLAHPVFGDKAALAAGNRRLRPGSRSARRPGQRLHRGRASGGGDPARRRPAAPRRAPAVRVERLGDGGAVTDGARAAAQAPAVATASTPGSPPSTGRRRSTRRCARPWSTWTPSPVPPARWTWCSVPAGTASCCTRPSAMAWRATSIARASAPSPVALASRSPRRASR